MDGYLLFSYPREDTLFPRVVSDLIRFVQGGTLKLQAARRQLRVRFPAADLHRQQSVRVRGEATDAWFAYRDGRNAPATPGEPWWEARGTPRVVVHSSGRLSHANDRGRSLLGIAQSPDPFLVAKDYLPADLCNELSESGTWLRELGAGSTSSVLSGLDRKPVDVEYHAVWLGRARDVTSSRCAPSRTATPPMTTRR
jgi:hypothetical protein